MDNIDSLLVSQDQRLIPTAAMVSKNVVRDEELVLRRPVRLSRVATGLVLFLFLTISLSSPAVAQVPGATLLGRVVDSGSRPMIGASVTLRALATNHLSEASTSSDGTFRFSNLPSGPYDLEVRSPGLEPFIQKGIDLVLGETRRVPVTLLTASLSETVQVTAEPAGLDVTRASAKTVIDTDRIEELPVQSRNVLEFVLLAPGVVSTAGAARAGATLLPDSGFSFAGLSPRSNVLTIDGLSNNDEFSGANRTELSPESVKEFEVVGRSWLAESGGGAGGTINVVTRSGSNVFHGDAFLLGANGRFDSAPFLETTSAARPGSSRLRVGGALGGPLVRDRSFFYVAAEQERARGADASELDQRTRMRVDEALASPLYSAAQIARLSDGFIRTSLDESELSTRVDHQLTSRESLALRASWTSNQEKGDAFRRSALDDFSTRGSNHTDDLAGTAALSSILGERMTNEWRGQMARRAIDLNTTQRVGPTFSIAGVAEFGRGWDGNSQHTQRYLEMGDTVGLAAGHHFFRAGGDVTRISVHGQDRDGAGGLFVFRSLEAFAAGRPDSYRQIFADSRLQLEATRAALFLQDEWTRGSLTLHGGLRAERETLPARLRIKQWQLDPRLGFAWGVSSRLVIRGSAGTYADRIPLAALERALVVDGTRGYEQLANGETAAAALAASRGGSPREPLAVSPSIYTVQAGNWNPSSRQLTLGAESLITPLLTASASIIYARGTHLLRTVNVNLPPPTILTPANAAALGVSEPTAQQLGRPFFGKERIDPRYDAIFQLQPTASSSHKGFTIGLNRRMANEIEWAASYTWSKTTDDASDFSEQPQNPYALNEERGASRFDQRHRFVASALIELGDSEDRVAGVAPSLWEKIFANVELAPIVSVESGLSANPIVGIDANRSGAFPFSSRPLGDRRNSLRLPSTWNLNLRLLKYFPIRPHARLDLVIEAFNLLNRRNVTEVNNVWGSESVAASSFERALSASSARRIDASIDLEF